MFRILYTIIDSSIVPMIAKKKIKFCQSVVKNNVLFGGSKV